MSKYDGHITALRGEVQFRKNQAQYYLELAQRADSELKELREKNAKLEADAQALREEVEALRKDKDRLDAIEGNCWDVRYDSSQNGDAGDSSISIEIVGHYQGAPHVRVLGENYTENLRAAIDQAMTAEAYPPERPEYDDHGRPLRALLGEGKGHE